MKLSGFVYFTFLVCTLEGACYRSLSSKPSAQGVAGQIEIALSNAGSKTARHGTLRDVASTLSKQQKSSWPVEVHQTEGNESFSEIHFIDQVYGWAVGARSLHRTIDGGKTWRKVETPLSEKSSITAAFFGSPLLGWVAANQCSTGQSCGEDHLRLTLTSDGGQTWQLLSEMKDSLASRISFVDERNGWLIGTRTKNWGVSPFSPLVLRTSDQGRHWVDVSGGINLILKEDKDLMRSPTHDDAAQLIAEGNLGLSILTGRGRIFRTVDGGQTWNQDFVLSKEPDQTCLGSFGRNRDKYFLAGGAVSQEGVWGMFTRESGNSWVRYRLPKISFSDLLALDEDRLIASGAMPSDSTSGLTEGVILSSFDGGRTWSIIYRNASVRSINALTNDASGAIWAAAGGGLIIKLQPPSV